MYLRDELRVWMLKSSQPNVKFSDVGWNLDYALKFCTVKL